MRMAHLVAVATILMWSSLAVLTVSVNHIPPLLSVGCVLVIAALPGLRYWRSWRLKPTQWLCGVVGMFGYHFLLFDAFTRAPAINVNLIQYLWPLFIVLGTPLVTRFTLNWGHLLGGALGFTGIAVALSPELDSLSGLHLFGYSEAFVAALLWAFYTLSNKRNQEMTASAVAGICFVSGALSILSYLVTDPEPLATVLGASELFSIIALGLGPMGLAFYSWDYALRHGDPRFIGSLSYFTPLISTLLMVLVYQQMALGAHHLVALAMVTLGASLGKLVERFLLERHMV